MIYALLLVLGITAGLRSLTPLAALGIGAYLGWIDLTGTWAAFVGHIITVAILVVLAIVELVGDQLPRTGSRKTPANLVFRALTGAAAGLVLGWTSGNWIAGIILGAVGAQIGTFGGFEARRRLAKALGRDLPAALIEDVVAIAIALAVVYLA